MNSVCYLKDYEHATSRALFGKLLPFAATLADMCLDRAYVDLLCFDYRESRSRPPVVLWVAHDANQAYMEWDELPLDEQFDEEESVIGVPWNGFLIPVASDFTELVNQLRARV